MSTLAIQQSSEPAHSHSTVGGCVSACASASRRCVRAMVGSTSTHGIVRSSGRGGSQHFKPTSAGTAQDDQCGRPQPKSLHLFESRDVQRCAHSHEERRENGRQGARSTCPYVLAAVALAAGNGLLIAARSVSASVNRSTSITGSPPARSHSVSATHRTRFAS